MLTIARNEVEITSIRTFENLYLGHVETTILVNLIKSVNPRVTVEVGCQQGRTAKTVLANIPWLEAYIGIDVPAHHAPTLACQRDEVPHSPGIFAAGDPRFFLLQKSSLEVGPQDLEPCDAFFIDGDHSERAVAHDSNLARALVRPGGIIIWHDYNNPAVEVTKVLDLLEMRGWPIVAIEGSWLAFCRIGGNYAAPETA